MAEPMKLKAEGVAATPFEIPGSRGQFRIQILNEDAGRGVVTSIVHIPPGGFIPAHFHEAGPEMHFVLSGDLIEHGERLAPGAFLTHAPGVVHGPHESEGGAQVLTVQSWQSHEGQFDFHIAEGEATGGDQPQGGAPAGDAGEAGEALASEGIPKRDEGGSPQERKATEQSLGRGYG
ncbi:cupin domain-containing protein [Roseicella aerolata]|uniref:Cupin domain-containing protein n=1 Tax=Roseicella aerolata TaxID=2883479 RepID=A0A9X1IIZ1_9PROT|nr:cupin domain-containing protein [Roseicella aerolata]MCB4824233.1 cupin domain-containing protein [Roseicella aerolata]